MRTALDSDTDVAQLDCRETVRRLWDYLDHELSESEVTAVDAHLARCDQCPPHFAYERRFLDAVRVARAERGAHATLRDRVRGILGIGPDADRVAEPKGDADV